jgi:hypothetical protein
VSGKTCIDPFNPTCSAVGCPVHDPSEVGKVDYQLRHDAFLNGPFIIERIEVMAVCESRDEAVEWMRTSRPQADEEMRGS